VSRGVVGLVGRQGAQRHDRDGLRGGGDGAGPSYLGGAEGARRAKRRMNGRPVAARAATAARLVKPQSASTPASRHPSRAHPPGEDGQRPVIAAPAARQADGWVHWLLVRRSVSDPGERDYYRVYTLADTAPGAMVRAVGRRWCIEAAFADAKGVAGLADYEVRRGEAWHRHGTLSLLAHAALVAGAAVAAAGRGARHAAPHRGGLDASRPTPHRAAAGGAGTHGSSSAASSGCSAPARAGARCRNASRPGTPSTTATRAGASTALDRTSATVKLELAATTSVLDLDATREKPLKQHHPPEPHFSLLDATPNVHRTYVMAHFATSDGSV
jgi:hypothetical protein